MESIKLSYSLLVLKWTTMCVDWFMNLFADPEYYWVEEYYPNRTSKMDANKTKNEQSINSISKKVNLINGHKKITNFFQFINHNKLSLFYYVTKNQCINATKIFLNKIRGLFNIPLFCRLNLYIFEAN